MSSYPKFIVVGDSPAPLTMPAPKADTTKVQATTLVRPNGTVELRLNGQCIGICADERAADATIAVFVRMGMASPTMV